MHIPKRLAGLAAVALTAGLALAACGDDAPDVATPSLEDCVDNPNDCNSGPRAEGGTITWLINQGWDEWNHHRPEGGSVYLFQALQGIEPRMGYFEPSGDWVWDMDLLAAEPELTSEDPLTIVFQIRPEAVWSDGVPIDVDDMLWYWYHNSGREDHCVGCNPRSTAMLDQVESIVGSDNGKTITVTYQAGVADPEWFARFGFTYPAHASGADWQTPEGMGESSEYYRDNYPTWSGGPYLIETATLGETVVKVPNPEWYGAEPVTLETHILEVVSDQGSWLPALQNRDLHGGSPASFPVDILEQLEGMEGVLHATGSGGAVWDHVDINMDNEWLADPALRRAIFTAIDKADARQRIFGGVVEPPFRTNHIFSEVSPHHVNHEEAVGYGTGDLDAARQILADAGYEGYDTGTLTKDGEPVGDLRFAWLQGNENRATFVQLAQSYLGDIGLTIVPTPTPGDQLGQVLGGQDYDLVIFGWSGSPLFTNAPHQFYHSTSGSNFGKLNNPQIDQLVEEVRNQIDINESARLANEAVALVYEEAYVLPLWDTLNLMFVTDDYINIRDNHQDSNRSLYNVGSWGLAATAE